MSPEELVRRGLAILEAEKSRPAGEWFRRAIARGTIDADGRVLLGLTERGRTRQDRWCEVLFTDATGELRVRFHGAPPPGLEGRLTRLRADSFSDAADKLKVIVFGSGVSIEPVSQYLVWPPPPGAELRFTVRGDRPGPASFRVEFVSEGDAVGCVDWCLTVPGAI